MQFSDLEQLLAIAKEKQRIDQGNDWSNGSSTYLAELAKEVVEVQEEVELQRPPYLEEELGDVLWDYLNLLLCLGDEGKVDLDRLFARAANKYRERIDGIQAGDSWDRIKQRQKQRLAAEFSAVSG